MKRRIVMSTSCFEEEDYRCGDCQKDLVESEITDWKCNYCGERVIIYSPMLDQEIVRKLPNEVTKQDTFLMHDHQLHTIYSITKKDNGDYKYVLKGFGTHTQDKYSYVNILY